jgi:sucrose-6-phosphate hydrolase SacC (GH32 family)
MISMFIVASVGADRPYWCPSNHQLRGIDPSAPLLGDDGIWHVYETGGGWNHFTSKDLLNWDQQPSTGFDVATGSVTPAPKTSHNSISWLAFYGNTSTPFPCCDIDIARSTNQSTWERVGIALKRPANLSLHQGFRDPHRPIKFADSWWMGIGSGSGADSTAPIAGRIHWFKGDDTMTRWEDAGIFFEVKETHGYTDPDTIVWNATYNRPFDQIECPDVFELNGSVVVLGSLQYDGPWQGTSTTWWVGTVSAEGRKFTPVNAGLLDYGQVIRA